MVCGISLQERHVILKGAHCDTENWLTRWKGQSFFISLRLQHILLPLFLLLSVHVSLILSLQADSLVPQHPHTFPHYHCLTSISLPPSRRQLVSLTLNLLFSCRNVQPRGFISLSLTCLSPDFVLCWGFPPSFLPAPSFSVPVSIAIWVSIHILSCISSTADVLLAWLRFFTLAVNPQVCLVVSTEFTVYSVLPVVKYSAATLRSNQSEVQLSSLSQNVNWWCLLRNDKQPLQSQCFHISAAACYPV